MLLFIIVIWKFCLKKLAILNGMQLLVKKMVMLILCLRRLMNSQLLLERQLVQGLILVISIVNFLSCLWQKIIYSLLIKFILLLVVLLCMLVWVVKILLKNCVEYLWKLILLQNFVIEILLLILIPCQFLFLSLVRRLIQLLLWNLQNLWVVKLLLSLMLLVVLLLERLIILFILMLVLK